MGYLTPPVELTGQMARFSVTVDRFQLTATAEMVLSTAILGLGTFIKATLGTLHGGTVLASLATLHLPLMHPTFFNRHEGAEIVQCALRSRYQIRALGQIPPDERRQTRA
mmetsp:Transcript_99058/g.180755  ORF Transcript_99058/g.180755 Transcript_99058/m.180755 type:complete len:110 (-) Transcript_99058:178-507(-)